MFQAFYSYLYTHKSYEWVLLLTVSQYKFYKCSSWGIEVDKHAPGFSDSKWESRGFSLSVTSSSILSTV